MPFEVSCSQCQGRLRVEQAGLVACPHCGTRLTVGEPQPAEASASAAPAPVVESPVPVAPSPTLEPAAMPAPEPVMATEPASLTESPTEAAAPVISGEQMPYLGDTGMPAMTPVEELSSAGSALDDEDYESVIPSGHEVVVSAPVSPPVLATETPTTPDVATLPATVASEPAPPVASPAQFPHVGGVTLPRPDSGVQHGTSSSIIQRYSETHLSGTVPKRRFVFLLSYSSAMTLATLYLAWLLMNGGGSSSSLESLPDVRPQRDADGNIGMSLIKEEAVMPPGHTLALGESRRFGNLKVTPLKVTRGPVQFEFHLKDQSRQKPDGGDILQLWVRFENVSTDQSIAPLDGLVFRRDPAFDIGELDRANNFVCARDQKKRDGHRVLVYELNRNDVWNLRDHGVEFEIPPGEAFETYIPTTEEGVKELLASDAPYVWRVHFRKGYSSHRYGVTTVVEVNFDKTDVIAATAKASANEVAAEKS